MGLFDREKNRGDVDLTEPIDLREEPAASGPTWGMPTQCPECGANGYLDHINLRARVMDQHCPTCFHRWTTSEAECTTTV